MIRKATAIWHGTGRAGNGDLTTDSGVLDNTPYSFKTRFENEKGTNPEELIAAAHAGCFTMALAFQLQALASRQQNSLPMRRSVSTPRARASESADRRSPCAPKCQIWTKPHSIGWPAMPRRIARSPKSSMPRSRSTPSLSELTAASLTSISWRWTRLWLSSARARC